jgi:hypothetical protein
MLPFHPVANLFPLIDGQEFEELKADIAAHGQREPVWTYEGKIIDGRNRVRVCEALGIEPRLREWEGNGSLVSFVLSLNLHRRHLSSPQRAAIAVDLLPLLEAEARERQRQAGSLRGRGQKVPEKVPEAKRDEGEARQQAARLAGTNSRYVSMAKRIKEDSPQVFEKIRTGELNVTEAKREIEKQKKKESLESRPAVSHGPCYWLDEVPSWSHKNSQKLEEELVNQPPFDSHRKELEALDKEAEVLDAEKKTLQEQIDRLTRQIRNVQNRRHEKYWTLRRMLREEIEWLHGPLLGNSNWMYRIEDPEQAAKLKECASVEEQQRLLRQMAGRCVECTAQLDERDNVLDEPGYRFVYCWWCRNHRGITHCNHCGAPLSSDKEKKDGWCKVCIKWI